MKIAAIAIVVLIALASFWLWAPDKPRASLEAKYLAAPGDMLDVAGVGLHVRDSGPKDAPAIIMLHGFGSSLHTWEGWARALEQDYRVIRLDLPGSGLSGPDPTGDYTDARTTEILLALMNRLGLARASLAGNSIGGRIAWRFAATHPERVIKLVLVAPDGVESDGIVYGRAPVVSGTARAMRYVLAEIPHPHEPGSGLRRSGRAL